MLKLYGGDQYLRRPLECGVISNEANSAKFFEEKSDGSHPIVSLPNDIESTKNS